MHKYDHKRFRKKLYNILNKEPRVISTIDHPYASPPARLIDGHSKLQALGKNKALLCIWDVNYPNVDRHRYELSCDTGIFSTRDEGFFIFSPKLLYPLQNPNCIDFEELEKRATFASLNLHDVSKKMVAKQAKAFQKNLQEIIRIYKETITRSVNGTYFYKNLLTELYKLLELDSLSNFFCDNSISYFNSSIMREWIPYCINTTKNNKFGLLNLIRTGLFKKPYLRSSDVKGEDINCSKLITQQFDSILDGIRNGSLIPSYEIFFWTLFLARIQHFGNDYGFFSKLQSILNTQSLEFSGVSDLQVTQHNKDSKFLIKFEKDRSFNVRPNGNSYKMTKNNPLKPSRVSSITALYCHLGNKMGRMTKEILHNNLPDPCVVKMGEIQNLVEK